MQGVLEVTRNTGRGILILAALFLTVSSAALAEPAYRPVMPDPAALLRGYCSRVVDGDTAWFEVTQSGVPVAHSFRLIGVDTPETVHPDRPVEPWGAQASAFTAQALEGRWAYLEYDIEKTDAYGRQLAYVWLEDGTLLNYTLLEQGLGRFLVIAPNVKYSAHLIAAQKAAQAAGAGLWSPRPALGIDIDLKALSVAELLALQGMIAGELALRGE